MRELAEAVQRASEFRLHPLGFFYLQDAVGKGRMRRVHIWLPDGPDRPENDRHQHSFDIESVVVAGRMRSELFRFEEGKPDGPEVEYTVTYDGHESILMPTGRRGRLLPIVSFETAAGTSYRLESGVIHRVAVICRPCITVVRTFERHVPIFSYGHEEEEAFDRRLCAEGEAEQIRRHLVHAAGG
ncbi:MAG: hypothetical protein E5W21_13350 [Mesorhizobium sp.]|nr:MAG: hypothetical protein E5W21_13350 [Mesorhizobium sp.]